MKSEETHFYACNVRGNTRNTVLTVTKKSVGYTSSHTPTSLSGTFRLNQYLGQLMLKCCFTSTETVGLLGTGGQDVHLDFHTAPEL